MLPPEHMSHLLEPDNIDILKDLLSYHIVTQELWSLRMIEVKSVEAMNKKFIEIDPGRGVITVCDDARILFSDLATANGIIHIIDKVMLPQQTAPRGKDILGLLSRDGGFETLLYHLRITGLDSRLQEEGPVTLFAPNDEAFANAPILFQSIDVMRAILSYHIVEGEWMTYDLLRSGSASTWLNGEPVFFREGRNGECFVNDAEIVKADILASNGMVNKIETLLLPE
jgi:uncharacterized surface protein with fasciclin (FAS1) repeats